MQVLIFQCEDEQTSRFLEIADYRSQLFFFPDEPIGQSSISRIIFLAPEHA